MKKIRLTASLTIILVGIFGGCKKNNDKKAVCHIVSISSTMDSLTNNFTYDKDGKLIQDLYGASITTYSYDGSVTTITNYDTGTFQKRTIVMNNSSGLAINVRTEYDPNGANWANSFYEYNGDEVARVIYTYSGNPSSTSTYLWADHNMVGQVTGTDTTTFEYYTDKPRQDGDYLYLTQVVSGYEVYRCKNLLKGYVGATFTYDFTPDGKIAAFRIPALNTVLSYEYLCN